ncbi:MAG: deoxyribose-phosphate aldolase [bacterium]
MSKNKVDVHGSPDDRGEGSGVPGKNAGPSAGGATAGNEDIAELERLIDHTLLKPDATREQIGRLVDEALRYRFRAVCVNSGWAAFCGERLRGSDVSLAVVTGFPLGAMASEIKAAEARFAVEAGADEIDMVMNIGALKGDELDLVREDIRAVTRAAGGATIKVIIETVLLSDEQKVRACRCAQEAGAAFVKTSTGFAGGGATVEDVALMRRTVGSEVKVKASGGIRSREDALAMLRAGADRLGTSAGVAIVTG